MGLAELIENPERMPASIKSILMEPHVSKRLLSTRKVRPSCSYFASLSLGSSRARPREGPAQPPPMMATRRAESILFWSIYDLRFCVAKSVTSNIIHTPYLIFNLNVRIHPDRKGKPINESPVMRRLPTNLFFIMSWITLRNIGKYVNNGKAYGAAATGKRLPDMICIKTPTGKEWCAACRKTV